jgi:hypothetical protein
VNSTGTISDFRILQGLNSAAEKAVLQLAKGMPNFNAGKQNGQAVDTFYLLKVGFPIQ